MPIDFKQIGPSGAVDGQSISYNSTTGLWEPVDMNGSDINVAFATDSNPYVSRNAGNTYAAQAALYFRGSDTLGTPTNIELVKQAGSASPTHSYRIYDITNSLVIAEVTGISSVTLDILDMGTLSNIPTSQAVFEIQVKKDGGGNVGVSLYAASVLF